MIALLLALGLLSPAARAERVERVGTHGASIQFEDGWTRSPLVPMVGRDQFHDDTGLYLIVRELQGTFLDEEDLRRHMTLSAANFAQHEGVAMAPATFNSRKGVFHAHQLWRAVQKGVGVSYDVHIFGQGGLGYLVLAWTENKNELDLRREFRLLDRHFQMPGPDSDWARSAAAKVEEFEVGDVQVRFAYPGGLLVHGEEADRGDSFAGLTTADGNIHVFLLMAEADQDIEQFLDDALSKASAPAQTIEQTQRFDVRIDGRPGRVATYHGKAEGMAVSGAVAAVALADGSFLDVRFLTFGAFESRQAIWDGLLQSIDVEELPPVDAFPVAKLPGEPTPLTPHQSSLLEASTALGDVRYGSDWLLSGGKLYVEDYQGVSVMALKDGQTETLFAGGATRARLPAVRSDGLHIPVEGGGVVRGVGDRTEDAGFTAVRLSDAGKRGLVIVRAPERVNVVGFANVVAPTGQQLILRDAAGEERVLWQLGTREVEAATVAGDESLLALSDPLEDYSWNRRELVAVSLVDGSRRTMGSWQWVGSLAPSSDGWLVAGVPSDGSAGVYRLSRQGDKSLLISGSHSAALPLDDDALLLVTTWRPPSVSSEGSGLQALRVPFAAIRANGALFDPFTASNVQQVARAALATVGLEADPARVMADPATIRRFLDAANRESEARVGTPLPRDVDGVDRLINGAVGEAALGDEAYILLCALLSDQLLASGATWAGGGAQARLHTYAMDSGHSNDQAVGYLPMELVRSTLHDDDEGWWSPASAIRGQMKGRRLVIGVDGDAVQQRVEALGRPGMEELARTGTVEQIVAWLDVEPANIHLREALYLRLISAGRAADLGPIAAPFIARGSRSFGDLRASLAGRIHLGVTAADAPALVEELRAAIAEHPDESALYVLLGRVYQVSENKDSARRAAACYRHVIDELPWGGFKAEAQAALETLGQ
jgi:hypothetical protein